MLTLALLEFQEAWALSKGRNVTTTIEYIHADDPIEPSNMLAMLYTWQAGDCSDQEPYNGDFGAAMRGIKAKTLVLPGKTDLYFRMLNHYRNRTVTDVI